jgi:scyllo-inositol 2-dehydrogenase (NADP+)
MIRVGLVGFGLAGRVFHAPLVSSVEGLELAAVVERSSSNAAARYSGVTTYRTIEELLADTSIKLVVIATPNSTHYDIALRALEAAKHVVVDKPLALASNKIAELVELSGGLGLHLIPYHNRRWDGDFRTVQALLKEKTLGNLVHYESNFDRWKSAASSRAWKEDEREGGILFDLGTHVVDQALTLFGPPESVGAEVRRERDGEGPNDAFTIRLHYYTGFSVTLGANCLASLPRPRFYLRGSKGNFWKNGLDPQEEALGKVTRIDAADWGKESAEHWGTLRMDADGNAVTRPVETAAGDYRLFYEGVRDAILGKAPAPVAAVGAWRAVRVLEWAEESAKAHRDIECDWSSEPR